VIKQDPEEGYDLVEVEVAHGDEDQVLDDLEVECLVEEDHEAVDRF
jgi:hypothetical protein